MLQVTIVGNIMFYGPRACREVRRESGCKLYGLRNAEKCEGTFQKRVQLVPTRKCTYITYPTV
jgi:hypothetical protein